MPILSTLLDSIPGDNFLTNSLQYDLVFTLGSKTLKKGRLLLFKRVHYHIQITILNSKNERESFEIPIPFNIEEYPEEHLIYFDYRLHNLFDNETLKKLNNTKLGYTHPSHFLNKILEIQTLV